MDRQDIQDFLFRLFILFILFIHVDNYLNATGFEVGLLINFGAPKLEYKRFTRSKDFKHG